MGVNEKILTLEKQIERQEKKWLDQVKFSAELKTRINKAISELSKLEDRTGGNEIIKLLNGE